MLTSLVIQDVVLIDRLTLTLGAGLNAFTGETGAGKSILLDALGLALGARGDAGLVRTGATQASVAAEFTAPDNPAFTALLAAQGLESDGAVILRRVVGKDGKSRAFFNDQPIGVNLLKQLGDHLLEVHGQFETHGLLSPATHRGLLDAFAGQPALRQRTAAAYQAWQQAKTDYAAAAAAQERARNEEDFLRAAVQELDELGPSAGETEQLAERRTGLQHREKILEALQTAEQALGGHRNGAAAALLLAGKAVAKIADKATGLNDILAIIDRAAAEVGEAETQLGRFIRELDARPEALQQVEERLFALRAVARKHNVGAEGLATLQSDLKQRLDLLTDQSDQLRAKLKAVSETRHHYKQLADELHNHRQQAAAELARLIMRELPPLKLERAQFVIEVAALPEAQWNADGMDRVTFLAATNPGTAPSALQKVASGGELARFMLALKVVLAASDPVGTLVFDEVDAGIGGATASAVGDRLARLANEVQVLVVTHSPQVAARGAAQLRVAKQVKNGQAVTAVESLSPEERIEEIARMLSGAQVTPAARQAAVSLMEDGQAEPKRKRRSV